MQIEIRILPKLKAGNILPLNKKIKKNKLRHILSRQSISIAVLPFIFLTLIAMVWLFPRFVKDTEYQNTELSRMIALKVESHLLKSKSVLQGVSNYIRIFTEKSNYELILHSQIQTSESLEAIYIINPDGKVEGVALKTMNPGQEKDLTALDLSGNPLFRKAIRKKQPIWSDTFLSVIGGGISVALAIPSEHHVVMGEIDLGLLTQYLGQIAATKEQAIMVLDRRGQVIADHDGYFTAQQLNLSHIPFIEDSLAGPSASTGEFKLNGKEMKGYIIRTSLIDWNILVATPKKEVYQSIWTGVILFSIIFITTVALSVLGAVVLARRLALKFENLAGHTRDIAAGKQVGEWPVFQVFEFKKLANDIQQMADAIREREAYSRLIFEDSPIPLLVMDPVSFKCLDGNEAVLRLLEIPHHTELIKYSILDFSADVQAGKMDADARIRDHIDQSLKHGFQNYEWVFFSEIKGTWYGDISLVSFQHGRKTLLQMSMIDITKRKIEEARRKNLEKQLIQARKMESIGTLAGGIAHDFNNLLFPILGFAEMALNDLPDGSELKHPLEEVLKGCSKAKDLVDKILIFSRQDNKKHKPIQAQRVIDEVLFSLKGKVPENIEIKKDVSNSGGLIMADAGHIHLIVSNLVANAVFTMKKEGGCLAVKLEDIQILSGGLPGLNLVPGWYVCLNVSDTGPGIAPEIQDMIFDPYFSTRGKGEEKGTGLGLSMVHGIVKSYQGDIIVESRMGKGAAFSVYLPRFVSTGHPEKKIPYEFSDEQGVHILLVDDEKPNLSMMEQMLENLGYQVSSYTNGFYALEAFETVNASFDLVITDLVMPRMSGDLLAGSIKKIVPDIPIILCTGFSERIEERDMSDFHVDAILKKPIIKEELAKTILKVLNIYNLNENQEVDHE